MLYLKLATVLLCGILDSIGGYCFLAARRFIMPSLLCVVVSISSHTWWLGLTLLTVMITLSLGYKRFGQGNFSRGCWLFVQSLLIGLGITLTGHLAWWIYIPYCVVSGVLGGTLVSVWQPLGDLIEGCWLGIIVLLIH